MNHVQKWWNDEIVPQIRNHGTPMLFPTEDIEDYIFESPNGESELLKELNSWVDEIITTYQNLPKNEPVAVWDDEGKFVLTMRELFLMRAMAPKEITLQDIYSSIIPFVLIMVFGLAIVMAFPEIATYLPEKYLSK